MVFQVQELTLTQQIFTHTSASFFPTSYICNFRYVCQLAFRNSALRAAGLAIFLSERAAQKKSCLDTKILKNGKKKAKGGDGSPASAGG